MARRVDHVPAATILAVDDVIRRAYLSAEKGGGLSDLADRDLTLYIMGVPRDDGPSNRDTLRKRLKCPRVRESTCLACGARTRWMTFHENSGKPPGRCPQHPAQRRVFLWTPL